MLKNRLEESKKNLKASYEYDEMTTVMGGTYDEEIENNLRKNMQNDIKQLEFILFFHKNNNNILLKFIFWIGKKLKKL
jgi:hypothetical protein